MKRCQIHRVTTKTQAKRPSGSFTGLRQRIPPPPKVNLSDSSDEDDDTTIPSSQMESLHLNPPTAETNPDAPSGSNMPMNGTESPPEHDDNEEDDEEWSFLTQYIGLSPSSKQRKPPETKYYKRKPQASKRSISKKQRL